MGVVFITWCSLQCVYFFCGLYSYTREHFVMLSYQCHLPMHVIIIQRRTVKPGCRFITGQKELFLSDTHQKFIEIVWCCRCRASVWFHYLRSLSVFSPGNYPADEMIPKRRQLLQFMSFNGDTDWLLPATVVILVLIAAASSECSDESAHMCRLARASAARIHKVWI